MSSRQIEAPVSSNKTRLLWRWVALLPSSFILYCYQLPSSPIITTRCSDIWPITITRCSHLALGVIINVANMFYGLRFSLTKKFVETCSLCCNSFDVVNLFTNNGCLLTSSRKLLKQWKDLQICNIQWPSCVVCNVGVLSSFWLLDIGGTSPHNEECFFQSKINFFVQILEDRHCFQVE